MHIAICMDYGNAKYRYCWTYEEPVLCFGLHRSRVGKYQKQTWKKSGLYKYTWLNIGKFKVMNYKI